ncbi:flagellar biosynthesis anti-sigma factor FlgM [Jeongeupia naejangsanensis]|uniref:Negative regulator of flagellin synthesis n=1 Tax=Jeongeupia naejangsanensis TaxID=613195 RepID=A0ABS2BFZ9_9NEIS|nr:flagellar biosynthesis anti-sigma factor FlgM [Jeongeupia naejangsanensis]MBM3114526.1 flagellar biosynthesis anti-sigma factor FlgM [Jeongeupia naejangsanensis]
MKIDPSTRAPIAQPTRNTERTSQTGNAVPADDLSVSINPAAAELGQTDSAGAPFDSERVAALRQAIAEGRFSVRADAIADKLIDSVKELLGR